MSLRCVRGTRGLAKLYFYLIVLCVLNICFVTYPNKTRLRERMSLVDDVRYILLWTPRYSPLDLIDEENSAFVKNRCEHYNCIVTHDVDYLQDVTQFDAVVFSGKELTRRIRLPERRAERQKYIFAATESARNYQVCDSVYDNFFNWTWTYRLDSDFKWGYITIYDLNGAVVGPKLDMVWPEMDPIGEELREKLSGKTKVAAWFVSNCNTVGGRERFFQELQEELENYSWSVDVYGSCGALTCKRANEDTCFKLLENDYHFYFSFENSLSEDYVTEKLTTALNNYAVPVVYGGANYSRFLPPGSYLNARKLGPIKLAATMDAIFMDKSRYYDFFRWRNHYRYRVTTEDDDICNLCAAVNDQEQMRKHSVHKEFRRWWNDVDSSCSL